jgi:hypothetical protein
MSWLTRLVDRIDARVDRPADQSVLTHSDRDGSERMIDSSTPEQAGATVRDNRSRSRRRWLGR